MKKLILSTAMLLTTGSAFADYGTGTINTFHVDAGGFAYFGTVVALTNICTNYGDHFRFDASTAGGKNMLAVLLAAKVAGTPIRVWYDNSTAPGTGQDNGCIYQAMAKPTNIGLQ